MSDKKSSIGLKNAGLISITKQQTIVKAKNPSILRKILRQKRESMFRLEDKIIDIMPILKQNYHSADNDLQMASIKGIEGAKQIYLEEVNEPIESNVYIWSYLISDDLLGAGNIQKDLQRKKKNLTRATGDVRTIIPLTPWTKHCLSYQYGIDPDYIKFNQFRYIENGMERFINRISIKNDTVRIISAEEDDIWGIKFYSPSLAQSLISLHKVMWNFAIPVTKELVQSFGENELLKIQRKK